MKICLATIHANARFTPLALLYLEAWLVEREGLPRDAVTILEFTKESSREDIVGDILAAQPDVVGLSCYVWNVKALMAVAAAIKARRPAVKIVLGGPEVGPIARSVLAAHPAVDAIVRSEGEIPFGEIARRWSAGRDVEGVAGIAFRRGDEIVESEPAPILRDLNELPSPHLTRRGDFTGRVICLETQRGCVFRCNFCFYNKDLSIRNRRFDLDRVKEEILFWLQQDVREIYLMDPIFNLNAERAKDICRFVAAHNDRRIAFHSEIWAEFVDEEMARLFSEANFQFLEVGLQTTDDTALATVERRLRINAFTDGIGYLKQYKLKFELQLILGLPGETMASFRKSLDFAGVLDPPCLAVFPLMVLPGTDLWNKARALELDFDPEPPYYIRGHFSMSAADIEYGWKMIDALTRFGDSKTVRLLCREPGVAFADLVDDWIDWDRDQGDEASDGYKVKHFILEVCARKAIPPDFYRGFASWEFRD